jgi:hypothetical protein
MTGIASGPSMLTMQTEMGLYVLKELVVDYLAALSQR